MDLEKENNFRMAVRSFASIYSLRMLDEFFDYWSEPNKKGKMKWELEKTWEISRRLRRWENNGFNKNSHPSNREGAARGIAPNDKP